MYLSSSEATTRLIGNMNLVTVLSLCRDVLLMTSSFEAGNKVEGREGRKVPYRAARKKLAVSRRA